VSADRPPAEPADDPAVGGVDDRPGAGPAADLVGQAMARARAQARRSGSRIAGRRPSAPVPAHRSGAWPDERDPQPLSAELDRLMADLGWAATLPTATVMGAWDEMVGAEVAAHCRPERLVDGELVLVAESTAWATQLRLLTRPLLRRLAEEVGEGVVTRLLVHGPTAPSWRRGPRRVTGRGPRDTYG
jgi:predicted nucleic acid-binding Zn ribbon protein